MNTPKEPSAQAIDAQRQAIVDYVNREQSIPYRLLRPHEIAALFAVQNLYDQLEKKHAEALAEIVALREAFTESRKSLIENAAARIKELEDELRAVQRALGGGARYESIERLFTK